MDFPRQRAMAHRRLMARVSLGPVTTVSNFGSWRVFL
jgi:hypothetical protein